MTKSEANACWCIFCVVTRGSRTSPRCNGFLKRFDVSLQSPPGSCWKPAPTVVLSTPTSSPNFLTKPSCAFGCCSMKLVPAILRKFQRPYHRALPRLRLRRQTLRPNNLLQQPVRSLSCYAVSSCHRNLAHRALPRNKRSRRSSLREPNLCRPSLLRIPTP